MLSVTQEDPPIDIQGIIERARQAVIGDPQHNLTPFYRGLIYSLFGPFDKEKSRFPLGKLAIIAVEKVLPIWENQWPTDKRPHDLLANAKHVLAGLISTKEGRLMAEAAFDQTAEWMGTLDEANGNKEPLAASIVLAAAVECLFEASGVHTFSGINPAKTEADLDPWSTDTAGWAASSYAGPWYDSASDPKRRREFWDWWITEAVPSVLSA